MLLLLLILLLLLHFTWINNFFRYLPTYIILSGSHFLRICTKSKECVWECAKRKREKNEIRWVVFALVWAKSTQLFCCFVDVVLLGNRKRKEREIWRSSLRSIEQLVVVISYKNHFYSVATHQRKIFWYILRRRHKMRSFSFSLVSIAFNSTRARAFYFSLFLPCSSSTTVSIFSQKHLYLKIEGRKKGSMVELRKRSWNRYI